MLGPPISWVQHWHWEELPTFQNWPIAGQGWPGEQSAQSGVPKCWFGSVPGAWPRRAGARVCSQLSATVWEPSPGHRPCRLDTFLQLLSGAKSQESTCCFTYSCQGGKNRLNPGCSHWLPIPRCCWCLPRALTQHEKADEITPRAGSVTISAVLDSSFASCVSRHYLIGCNTLWLLTTVLLLPCLWAGQHPRNWRATP